MNKFESCILRGAMAAQRRYEYMTGHWIWHANESFLNVHIGLATAKAGYYAYVDASVKKLNKDITKKETRGRKFRFQKHRPDIAVWYKSRDRLFAIIESKKAYYLSALMRDLMKIKAHLGHSNSAKHGYLLAYVQEYIKGNDVDRVRDELDDKIRDWGKKLEEVTLAGYDICRPSEVDYVKKYNRTWAWGFALYRVNK